MTMVRIGLFFIAISLIAALMAGTVIASDASKPAATVPTPTVRMPAAAPTAEPNLVNVKPDEVMAKYGDQKFTFGQIKYFIPSPTPESAKQLAQQWLDLQMMYNAAKKQGITDDPKAKLIAELNSQQVFARELMTKIANEVNIPDANVREYYEKNKETDSQLSEPVRLSFTHIGVKTLDEANSVIKRIKAGEDIDKIAKEVSIARDAKTGGMVKKLPLAAVEMQYGKEFADALLSASEGQIMGPVKTREGFEIARHEGKLSAKVLPFEQVGPMIKRNLEQQAKLEATQKFTETLKKGSQSKIYISPLLETPAPKTEEEKSAKETNLPVDKMKTKPHNTQEK
jgi:peptidyl-prolyl cis-trans isomerase C